MSARNKKVITLTKRLEMTQRASNLAKLNTRMLTRAGITNHEFTKEARQVMQKLSPPKRTLSKRIANAFKRATN